MSFPAARRACRMPLLVASLAAGATLSMVALQSPDSAGAAKPKPKVAVAKGLEAKVVRQVNVLRRRQRLSALSPHSRLQRSARGHSRFLARTGKASHVGGGGSTFWERIERAGYSGGRRSAETVGLAFGCHSSFATAMVDQWMRSPRHRRALMRGGYRRIGVGVTRTRSCSHTAFVINLAG